MDLVELVRIVFIDLGTPMQSNLCTRAYVEGYIKGYKRAKKDMKDDNR